MPRRWFPGHSAKASAATSAAFLRSRDGATAVEFGLVAMPFMALLFATIEISLSIWTTQTLETAVSLAGRQIYTGQFQTAPANQNLTSAQLAANFKTLVCSNVTSLFNCNALVTIDVRPVSSYAAAVGSSPIVNGQFDTTGYGYQPAASNQITVVRAAMQYPSVTSFLSATTALSNGSKLIMATAVFRTEPYSP